MSDIKIEVSVIIPCYNSEKYLLKTLESLENQIFKNFEVIIINDGSKDSTNEIVVEYKKKTNLKINYIVKKNSGVSDTRNIGIKKANGEYIVFLDADDVYDREFINKLYRGINEKDLDVVFTAYSRNVDEVLENKTYEGCDIELLNHNELMRKFMYREGPCGFWSFIYKKDIICNKNIEFNKQFKYGEDTQFTWKYLSHSKNGGFINEKLYGYRDNEFSVMNKISWRVTDTIKSVYEIEDYLKQNKDTFEDEFKNYLRYRTAWATLKDFAKSGQKDLYEKFIAEYDGDRAMKEMCTKSNDVKIKISSMAYCISPKLFYILVNKIL